MNVVCAIIDLWEKTRIAEISDHQQRWPRPLPGAILIPPALLVVADLFPNHSISLLIPDKADNVAPLNQK
jgi:hypothetical protein